MLQNSDAEDDVSFSSTSATTSRFSKRGQPGVNRKIFHSFNDSDKNSSSDSSDYSSYESFSEAGFKQNTDLKSKMSEKEKKFLKENAKLSISSSTKQSQEEDIQRNCDLIFQSSSRKKINSELFYHKRDWVTNLKNSVAVGKIGDRILWPTEEEIKEIEEKRAINERKYKGKIVKVADGSRTVAFPKIEIAPKPEKKPEIVKNVKPETPPKQQQTSGRTIVITSSSSTNSDIFEIDTSSSD